jgi:hypothetical protein
MVIIEMTPFLFEDGNTYYFQILKRESTNNWHDLYAYRKESSKNWLGKVKHKMVQINQSPELIDVKLNASEIKGSLKKIIYANNANAQIKGWDGVVGDVPDDVKKSLLRNSKLSDLLDD